MASRRSWPLSGAALNRDTYREVGVSRVSFRRADYTLRMFLVWVVPVGNVTGDGAALALETVVPAVLIEVTSILFSVTWLISNTIFFPGD